MFLYAKKSLKKSSKFSNWLPNHHKISLNYIVVSLYLTLLHQEICTNTHNRRFVSCFPSIISLPLIPWNFQWPSLRLVWIFSETINLTFIIRLVWSRWNYPYKWLGNFWFLCDTIFILCQSNRDWWSFFCIHWNSFCCSCR